MRYAVAGLTVCTLIWAGAASAGTAIADAEKIPEFSMIDTDGDGYISLEEADSVPEIKRIFASVDNDRDGRLDTSEWSEAVARARGLG